MDFDEILDSIPEDLSFEDAKSHDDSDHFATAEAAREASGDPGLSTDLVPEETQEVAPEVTTEVEDSGSSYKETQEVQNPELVQVEWYGEKGEISSNLERYLNKHYTEKMQAISAERARVLQEAEQVRAEAARAREEAIDLQARLQAHLEANPQLQESWNDDLSRAEEIKREQALKSELAELRNRFEQQQREQEVLRAQQQIETTLDSLSKTYRLEEGSQFTADDARQMALAQVISSGYQYDLNDVYPHIVAQLNQRTRSARKAYLAQKVETARTAPTSPPRQMADNVDVTKIDAKEMSWDDLLQHTINTLNLE